MQYIRVAAVEDIRPGKMKCVQVNGQRILVANVDGTFYATDDTCTHEDASLSTGHLHGEWVKCPLHGSRFNLRTGEAMEEPADIDLMTYPVRVDGNDVYVALTAPRA